jgi:hypothetical protein
MSKKSLEQLQYENAKLENDVNKGCAVVGSVFMLFATVFLLGIVILYFR